jgi:hypothetical protein
VRRAWAAATAAAKTARVALAGAAEVELPRAQERHRRRPRAHDPGVVGQRHQQAVGVQPTVGAARQGPDDVGADPGQDRRRRGQPGRRVVVAGDRHHGRGRSPAMDLGEEAEPRGQGARGRVAGVEHVAGHQHRVDRLGLDHVQEPGHEGRVLAIPRQLVQRVAQVPVRRVQDPHGR